MQGEEDEEWGDDGGPDGDGDKHPRGYEGGVLLVDGACKDGCGCWLWVGRCGLRLGLFLDSLRRWPAESVQVV